MAFRERSSTVDGGRGERWDRERFHYERDRDRFGDERVRFEERDSDRVVYRRGSPSRVREVSEERKSVVYDDGYVRDRRYYDERPYDRRQFSPRREREEYDRRVVIEKERYRSPSPRRPPTIIRRQSSLDTFDRRPRGFHEREEYGPPARREDFRPPTYVDIPLPRSRALPPPSRGRYERYEDIKVSDPDYYGDEEYRSYPERVREREVIRTRTRSRSRSRGRRSHSRSSTTTSSSSSSSHRSHVTIKSVKSEYPKKGRTRIPAKLLSKRAVIELGYPFEEEGSTIIILKALSQENIDDLLRLSEDYKKGELEVLAARSEPGRVVEERRDELVISRGRPYDEPATVVYDAIPPAVPVVPAVNNTTLVVRDISPARSCSTSTTSASTTSRTPVIIDAGPRYREESSEIAVGPVALAEAKDLHHHRHHHGHRRHRSSHSSRHRSRSRTDIVRAERLSDGQLVIYEERVERVEEPRRGVRIEKDRKGPPPGLVKAMLATLT